MKPRVLLFASTLLACGSDLGVIKGDAGSALPDGSVIDEDSGTPIDGSIPLEPAPGEGISISEIAVFQTLKIPVAKNGAPLPANIPLIVGKEALMRVYIHLEPGWSAHNVVGVLDITAGGNTKTMTDVLSPAIDSKDDALLSTFNFKLTPELVSTDTTFTVRVIEQTKMATPTGMPSPTQYPMDLTPAVLTTQSAGSQLKVTLIPMKYAADGSGRLPDTSQGQLDVYKNYFYSMYPAPLVQITVRAAVNAPSAITANGSGWNSALNLIVNLRQQDNAAPDVYYYGIFAPAASYATYCGGGCISGFSMISSTPTDSYSRAGVGLGFGGGNDGWHSAEVAAHEVAHQHGRGHAPCGNVSGVDPSFPYPQGTTDTVGYALTDIGIAPAGSILMPTSKSYTLHDIMSYCPPKWISDYNYKALFQRMKTVNGAAIIPGPTVGYRWAIVDENGTLTSVGARFTGNMPPGGEPRTVGEKNAWFYPFDHLAGGMMLISE